MKKKHAKNTKKPKQSVRAAVMQERIRCKLIVWNALCDNESLHDHHDEIVQMIYAIRKVAGK